MDQYKFETNDGLGFEPHNFENLFEFDDSRHCLIISSSKNQINLLLSLAATWKGRFFLLYVLMVSRLGNKEGRYQSLGPRELTELVDFCDRFRLFLETDGRHHFWIGSAVGSGNLIYDRHNIIYAYGNLESYKDVLISNGFSEGKVTYPRIHRHNYHAANDGFEKLLMDYWEWIYSPLQAEDAN